MNVKKARNILDCASKIQAQSGASEASVVFSRLARLMKKYDHEEFSEFVARVKKLQKGS
jgi:hypothetical protein